MESVLAARDYQRAVTWIWLVAAVGMVLAIYSGMLDTFLFLLAQFVLSSLMLLGDLLVRFLRRWESEEVQKATGAAFWGVGTCKEPIGAERDS
jgi:hypothetical protein